MNNHEPLPTPLSPVDTCNEHVGGGGGQPHLHGDPFGSWCLYSAANYSSSTVHPPQVAYTYRTLTFPYITLNLPSPYPYHTLTLPIILYRVCVHQPQIGWSFDGGSIFGRHINTQNLGYTTALDNCGGHSHDGSARLSLPLPQYLYF